MSGQKPREIALQVLERQAGGRFIEDLLDEALRHATISSVDRRLCQELVFGIVRWRATLDWLIAQKTAARTQKATLQNVLRLGLFQIFWLDRIPNHAAVNESVELARQRGCGPQAGFVNALLRGYLREFAATRQRLAELKQSQPPLGYSHPEWLVQRWQQRWGPQRNAQLLDWNNTPPKTFARINTLKIDAAKLLPLWREENVEYDFVSADWLEDNLVFELKAFPPLSQLASFQKGYFYIQDPSTLLAVQRLAPQPGERILDYCAAPGGKLTYLAQRMGDQGRVVALDLTPERLKLVEENCVRLGITSVQMALTSDSGLKPPAAPSFDRVLIDAPCSNTGVMRRRVDLRWRIRPPEIERLQQTQMQLLTEATRLLRPGGTLVYSTCSLEPEENEQVVQAAIQDRTPLVLEQDRQLTPCEDGFDGAYVAVLRRQ